MDSTDEGNGGAMEDENSGLWMNSWSRTLNTFHPV